MSDCVFKMVFILVSFFRQEFNSGSERSSEPQGGVDLRRGPSSFRQEHSGRSLSRPRRSPSRARGKSLGRLSVPKVCF